MRKCLSSAHHIKTMALLASHGPVAYNYLVASVLSCPGTFFGPDATAKKAEHIALALVHSAPMYAFSPELAVHLNLIGARTSCMHISRMAWAWKLRLVLCVPDVHRSLARVASARVAGSCLVPRHPGWRSDNIVGALERADRVALGSPAELQDGACIQRRISQHLQADGGLDRFCSIIARRASRLYGGPIAPGRMALIVDRLGVLFGRDGASVAIEAARIVVNVVATNRRFGQRGRRRFPFGCFAVGGDDLRRLCFCQIVAAVFDARRDWVRPGWLGGGITDAFAHDGAVHSGAWRLDLCGFCRAYNGLMRTVGYGLRSGCC